MNKLNDNKDARPGAAPMCTSSDIEAAIMQFADERQAAVMRRFFKTGPGEYGEGDCFLGVTNPRVREVVKMAWKQTDLDEAAALAASRWHEVRLCGLLIMVAHFERAWRRNDEAAMRRVVDRYLSLHPYINNWDLVDLSAYKIIGRYELLHPEFVTMDRWITPCHTLWQQRIAMVATWWHAHEGRYDRLLSRAEVLLDAKHDLLHKAVGWMLREMYKHDDAGRQALDRFLRRHISSIPSTMLSYATEKLPAPTRLHWQSLRKSRP